MYDLDWQLHNPPVHDNIDERSRLRIMVQDAPALGDIYHQEPAITVMYTCHRRFLFCRSAIVIDAE